MNKQVLKKGDRVSFLDEKMGGEILEVKGGDYLVLRDDEFEEWYPFAEIIAENDMDPGPILSKDQLESILSQKDKSSVINRSKRHSDPDCWSIDLHIEELTNDHQGLSNYEIVQIQLGHCQRFIEKAIRQNVSRLVIVHGVGAGVLRQEVLRLLKMYQVEQVFDANYQTYGWGATEVIL